MKKIIISISGFLTILAFFLGLFYLYESYKIDGNFIKKNSEQINVDGTGCPSKDDPVCGADGVTYANSCLADYSGAKIDHQGPCKSPTIMTDVERKYLLWFLREREKNDLESVSVRHLKTYVLGCEDCFTIFYGWDSDKVIARVEVQNGEVVSAIDTTGYDLLINEMGAPTVFKDFGL